MQITLERQSKTIALSFHADNSIAYDELYLAVQDKMSAIVNGGKFFVGKAFTIVGNAVSVLSKNIYVQGLTVAAAGGLGSRLAGGSFELGFLTAGLAFAVNQVLSGSKDPRIRTRRVLRNPRSTIIQTAWRETGGHDLFGFKIKHPFNEKWIPISGIDLGYRTFEREYQPANIYDVYEVEYYPVRPGYFLSSVDTGIDQVVIQDFIPSIEESACLTLGGVCLFDPFRDVIAEEDGNIWVN